MGQLWDIAPGPRIVAAICQHFPLLVLFFDFPSSSLLQQTVPLAVEYVSMLTFCSVSVNQLGHQLQTETMKRSVQ